VRPSGTGGGSDWDNASADLAAVLRNAQPGDEILAAEGVYVPAFDRDGNPVNGAARTFALKSGVKLLGGFPAEGSPSLQDRDPRSFPTVLTGDLFGDDQVDAEGKAVLIGQNAYHVVYAAGVDETAVLDGFVISGGRADGQGEDAMGGGMYCINASPVIENCVFRGNAAKSGGGGMYNSASSPYVSKCAFLENTSSGSGGGMLNSASGPVVEDCLFRNNSISALSGSANGGGMANLVASAPSVKNSAFIGNSVYSASGSGHGGGMSAAASSTVEAVNCTFSGNEASAAGTGRGDGGALYVTGSGSSLVLLNSTLSGNSAKNAGGGLFINSGSVTAANCIFFGSDFIQVRKQADGFLALLSCLYRAGSVTGTGIVSENSLFGDPLLGEPADNGGFTPTMAPGEGSPALDAGAGPGEVSFNGGVLVIPDRDQRGKERPGGGAVDIGACEIQWYSLSSSASGNGEGHVAVFPEAASYVEGTEVTLSAHPAESSLFTGWDGDLAGTVSPATLAMDGEKTVSAAFALKTFTVTTSAGPGGSVSPSATVQWGGSVTVTVTPDSGYAVAGLLVDGVPVDAASSYTFNDVTSDRTLAASFAALNPGGPGDPGDPKDPGDPGDPGDPEDPGEPNEPDEPDEPDVPEEPNPAGRIVIRQESVALDALLSGTITVPLPGGTAPGDFFRVTSADISDITLRSCSPEELGEGRPGGMLCAVSFEIGSSVPPGKTGILAVDLEMAVPEESLSEECRLAIAGGEETLSLAEAFLEHVSMVKILPEGGYDFGILAKKNGFGADPLDFFTVVRDEGIFRVGVRLLLADGAAEDVPSVQAVSRESDSRFLVFDGERDGRFRDPVAAAEREDGGVYPAGRGGCSAVNHGGYVLLLLLPLLLLTGR